MSMAMHRYLMHLIEKEQIDEYIYIVFELFASCCIQVRGGLIVLHFLMWN